MTRVVTEHKLGQSQMTVPPSDIYGKKILVDGDVLAHRYAYASERKGYDEDPETGKFKRYSNVGLALFLALERIELLNDLFKPNDIQMIFSGKRNFRKEIYEDYKGNRKPEDKPIDYSDVTGPLCGARKNTIISSSVSGLEADDMLGILQNKDTVICSIDKDLYQIPGYHINLTSLEVSYISPIEATKFFYSQILTGDTVDGYQGLPGVGPKTAYNLIEDALEVMEGLDLTLEEKLWYRVVEAYKEYGMDEDCALIIARCARILRQRDYKNGFPYWRPPKLYKNKEIECRLHFEWAL